MKERNKKKRTAQLHSQATAVLSTKTFPPADQRKEGVRIFMIQDIRFHIKTYITGLSGLRPDGLQGPAVCRETVMEICAGAGIPDAVLDGNYLRSFIVFREDADTGEVLRAAAGGRPLEELCRHLDVLTCHVTVPVIRIKDRESGHSHAILPCDAVPFSGWSLPVLLFAAAVRLIWLNARRQGKASGRGRGPSLPSGALPVFFTPGILRAIEDLSRREQALLYAVRLHDVTDPFPVPGDPIGFLSGSLAVREGPLAICWRCLGRQLFIRREPFPSSSVRSLLIT